MSTIRLAGVAFCHSDAAAIFDHVDLHLTSGWTGVVGPNGAGKTTLLHLMAGSLSPTRGTVTRAFTSIVNCPQEVELLDDAVVAFSWCWDKSSQHLRRDLQLDPDELERWSQLSAGHRKRWQIAAALDAAPDVLLLDEPTNHLDVEARSILLAALKRYRGVGLVVSHDRALLDALTDATVLVDRMSAVRYRGNYTQARETWEAERAELVHTAAKRTHVQRRVRSQLAAKRHTRARAEHSIKARPKSSGDSDGRSANRKSRAQKAEAVHAKRLSALKSKLARADRARAQVTVHKQRGGAVRFAFEVAPREQVIVLDREPLFGQPICAVVRRHSRIHLAGPNGCGKTTLLELLRRQSDLDERMMYLPQELDRAARRALLDEARELSAEARGRVMQHVALLGVDPDRLLASAVPSPGEARKLLIALGLGRQVWCMLLDEPTNHLDLPSIERLETALAAFPGAIVLVSHDARFASACCDERWTVPGLCAASPNRHISSG